MLRLAALADRPGLPPLDELMEMPPPPTRRRFLQTTALTGAAIAAGAWIKPEPLRADSSSARVAIVGAGIAGLNAAYKLKKAGVRAEIYEASARSGGRIFTARDLLGPGLTTELGGEFIDSNHAEIRALAKEFGLQLLDLRGPRMGRVKHDAYFFNGRHYTQGQAIRAFAPLAKKIAADFDSTEDVVDFEHEGGGGELDRMSIAEYIEKIGATGWMKELLDVAFVTEYGLETGEQSALNLIFLISTKPGTFEPFGDSDERYKVRGGNERIVEELLKRVSGQVHHRHRLEAIREHGKGFRLTFQDANGSSMDVDADAAILTLPFTMLREVDMKVDLPPWKSKAIRELGYGTNAKVLVGFRDRHWRSQGFAGGIFTNETFQSGWDNSALQPGIAGGFTFYSGGKLGMEAGQGTAEEAAARLMPGLERAFLGITAKQSGKVSRFHWPTHPFTKAAYSCFKPGQWTSIAGAEGKPVGNLFFAGEHTSYDFQGYMNGGAQSGKDAAEAVIKTLSLKPAARRYLAAMAAV
jgi:monoamine oxidase